MAAFIVILIVIAVIYFAMKGKGDRPEQLGAAKRGMTSGHIGGDHTFVTPYANHDEANHAPNENMTLDCFYSGVRTGAALLHELGQMQRPA